MTINRYNVASVTYAGDDQGAEAPCIFVWDDGRTETHPKSWTGFFRGVEGGRNAAGEECEWLDGCGMTPNVAVASVFVENGGAIAAYVPPPPPDPPAQ